MTKLFSALVGLVSAWRERADTYAELSAMTDRELRDMGLFRGDIRAVAAGRYRDDREEILAARAQAATRAVQAQAAAAVLPERRIAA